MKNFKGGNFDVIIIGGGFYGCIIALHLKKKFKNVVILEKESDLLLRASDNNQARVHNGYHYPRSLITALRSHINYSKFITDFRDVTDHKYLMTYAIAANNSKITSQQFIKLCRQIGSPLSVVTQEIRDLFNEKLIEDVFVVEEAVFDTAKLRAKIKKKLSLNKVKVFYKTEVISVEAAGETISLKLNSGKKIGSTIAINCAYANINPILKRSSLPLLPLKFELTEMPLVKLPSPLDKMGITIIDGPFFSIMPSPSRGLHTIHHVRYTPHTSKLTIPQSENSLSVKNSQHLYIINDAKRYLPLLDNAEYKGSLYEIKTLLTSAEATDARPILFKKNYGIKNFHIVLGAKIDNIYDILEEINV